MLTNAKVGTKLLALIIAPLMVLLAVASLGARDRLDEASEAERIRDVAALTALTDDMARLLAVERLTTVGALGGAADDDLAAAREETDAAWSRLEPVLASTPLPPRLDERRIEIDEQLADLGTVRDGIDAGDVAAVQAVEVYGLAIDELIRLERDLAVLTSAADLAASLADAATLSRAQEARGELTALGAVAIVDGEYPAGALEQYVDLRTEEERLLTGYSTDGAAAATELGDALATPEVAAADAQVDVLVSDATIGGAGTPQVELADWVTTQRRWIDVVGGVDSETLRNISVFAGQRAADATQSARLFMITTAGATLLSILLAVWVARSIDRPLRRLTVAADELATERLPRLVENLRSPDATAGEPETFEPIEVTSGDEIGQVTEAFNAIQAMTVTVAEEQSSLLRRGIGDIFVNLARRNQSLLDRQIEFIDELEAREQDPDLLENLFRLDHLATRMRRNAESLLVLAGSEPARRRARPVELNDVVRVAVGEVEDYTRIEMLSVEEAVVAGNLAVDLSHLLSELMENATHFSPPETNVEVAGQFGPDGAYVLTVADHGIGMSSEQLADVNTILENPPLVGLALGRSLGFIVVGRIAERLGLRVQLNASPAGGVTAVVSLPADLVAQPGEAEPRDPVLSAGLGTPAIPATPERAPVEGPSQLAVPDAAPPASGLGPSAPEGPAAEPEMPAPEPEEVAAEAPIPETPAFTSGAGDQPQADPPPPAPAEARSGQLSEALPEGEDFERGLASLIGPDADEAEIEQQFWGPLADEDEGGDEAPAPPAPPVTSAEGDLPPRGGLEDSGAPPAGLVKRTPGQSRVSEPAATGPAADAPRRSPEEVRAMLSRYRDGLKGRQDHPEAGEAPTTEERS